MAARAAPAHEPGDPFHLGLIGYPLGHSLSPRIHNAALAALDLPGEYRLFPIPPGPAGAEPLAALLQSLRRGDLHGLNVTIPHKQAVLPLLDDLTPTARLIGAVNTVFCQGGRLVGDNTDAPGFLTDLGRYYLESGATRQAIVLGAGGSARAVCFALLQAGWRLTIVARRLRVARELAASLQPPALERGAAESPLAQPDRLPVSCIPFSDLHALAFNLINQTTPLLIVNTTPVGMAPDTSASPWPESAPWPSHAFLYDLVYNPLETALLRSARAHGLAAVGGLGMLVEQAALAFERWTGSPAPRGAMRAAVHPLLDA